MLFMRRMSRRERRKSILAAPLTLRKGGTDTQGPSEMRKSNPQLHYPPTCGTQALTQSQKSSGPSSLEPNHTREEGGCATFVCLRNLPFPNTSTTQHISTNAVNLLYAAGTEGNFYSFLLPMTPPHNDPISRVRGGGAGYLSSIHTALLRN